TGQELVFGKKARGYSGIATVFTAADEELPTVAFAPDGKTLASGSQNGCICLWDAAIGTQRQPLRGDRSAIHSIAFTPDGKTLASGSSDRTVRLWDLARR